MRIPVLRYKFEGYFGDYTEKDEVLYGLKLNIGPSFWMLDDGPYLSTLESAHTYEVDELRQVIFEVIEWDNIFPVITESGFVIFGNNPNVVSKEIIHEKVKELFSDYNVTELEEDGEVYGLSFSDVENGKRTRVERINASGIKERRKAPDPFLKPIEGQGQLEYDGDVIDVTADVPEKEEAKVFSIKANTMAINGAWGLSFDKKELAFLINKYQNSGTQKFSDISKMSEDRAEEILMAADMGDLQFFDYRISLTVPMCILGNNITDDVNSPEISSRLFEFMNKNNIPATFSVFSNGYIKECIIEFTDASVSTPPIAHECCCENGGCGENCSC